MRRRLTEAAVLIAAWMPILLFWLVLIMVYGHMTFAASLPRAVLTVGSAALLGIAVRRFCALTPWPGELRVRFYALHFIAAAAFAAIWSAIVDVSETLLSGWPIRRAFASSVLGWQLIMGLWLYGVIAGISYAIQTQRRARDNELRALSAEGALTAARLDALQSRLHPHFLFNALHTVAALVRQDPAQAEGAIERLGDILRYTLQESSGETVPFAEEWEFTRRYLEFEQLRYAERLRVTTAIDPACDACRVPSFALQTLVENAVRHSIATRAEGGTIEITARTSAKELLLRVWDDGGNGLAATQEGAHFGLSALRERLLAVYGCAATLNVRSDPSGFEVSFAVPCTRIGVADDE
jgi:two-component system LytT family sensor kinase